MGLLVFPKIGVSQVTTPIWGYLRHRVFSHQMYQERLTLGYLRHVKNKFYAIHIARRGAVLSGYT